MKNNYIVSAFTLVELIVVITVLSILSTIASIYLFDSFTDGRDAARMTDITLIGENLELFYIEESQYPVPDEAVDIMHEGAIAWSQGVFGTNVTKDIRNFGQDIPSDPKYNNFYSYSITNSAREYQIATIFEGLDNNEQGLGEIVGNIVIPKTHAGVTSAYVRGNYNNLMVKASGEGIDYYIATPSIIVNDLSLTGAVDIIKEQKLVYNEFFNLPASYTNFMDTDGGFGFNVTDPLIFSGSTQNLKTDTAINDFSDKLKYIYSTTPTESFDVYQSLLDNDTSTKIKGFLQKNYNIVFKYHFDCRDILDAGQSDGNKFYKIDVDGSGPIAPKEVFCDMTTGGGGWTKKSGIYLDNGFFEGGLDITGAISYPTSSENQIVSIDNPAYTESGYALHQTGDNSSYYEVKFSNFSELEVGDEVRMTLWVADEDDDSWSSLLNINPHAFYMFHNRIYYTDGTFSTNGKVRLLDTREVGGKTWKLLQVRHEVKKQPQDFSWFIGRDAENTKDLYVTGVDLEIYYGGYSSSEDSLYNSKVLAGGGGTIPDSGPSVPEWWDLRSGGKILTDGNAPGNDIRYRNGMTMNRSANGISFSGNNGWGAWVKFESAAWNRGDNKTIEWIYSYPTNSHMMLGIGSFNTNENNSRQYRQAEIMGYILRNGTRIWGLYGNSGSIGSQGRQRKVTNFSCSSGIFKTRITYDGTVGGGANFSLYCLPETSLIDHTLWDDESDELTNFAIAGSLDPDEDVLLPFITPRGAMAKYIGLKVY